MTIFNKKKAGMYMSNTLKVRDRTTGKVRDVLVDKEDYDRLKEYKYLTDKNSKEPFREYCDVEGLKRQRISLKRDVMDFKSGDPRRVCYVDKSNFFDCRKANLKCKSDTKPAATVVASVVEKKTRKKRKLHAVKEVVKATEVVQPTEDTKVLVPDTLEMKTTVLTRLGEEVLTHIPIESLLSAWAEANGYKKEKLG